MHLLIKYWMDVHAKGRFEALLQCQGPWVSVLKFITHSHYELIGLNNRVIDVFVFYI